MITTALVRPTDFYTSNPKTINAMITETITLLTFLAPHITEQLHISTMMLITATHHAV